MANSCDSNIAAKPSTTQIAAYLKVYCDNPTKVPKRILKKVEVIEKWNTDRKRLRACKNRHKALVEAVNIIEGRKIK